MSFFRRLVTYSLIQSFYWGKYINFLSILLILVIFEFYSIGKDVIVIVVFLNNLIFTGVCRGLHLFEYWSNKDWHLDKGESYIVKYACLVWSPLYRLIRMQFLIFIHYCIPFPPFLSLSLCVCACISLPLPLSGDSLSLSLSLPPPSISLPLSHYPHTSILCLWIWLKPYLFSLDVRWMKSNLKTIIKISVISFSKVYNKIGGHKKFYRQTSYMCIDMNVI